MFKTIKTRGETLEVNTNTITTLLPQRLNGKYIPTIVILPGKQIILEIEGAPFDTEEEALDKTKAVLA